jgi:hypothetical protein
VTGMTGSQAAAAITSAGLIVGSESSQCSNTVPAGQVVSQDPAAGASVAAGSAVNLVTSSGPCPVSVPDVAGLTQSAARSAIASAGLVVGTVTQAASDTTPKGSVISQNPVAGTSVAKNSAVNLIISSGPAVELETTARIIWISDGHQTVAGAATADDQGWVDLLRSEGYEVDYQPPVGLGAGYWQTLDAVKLAALDAADLVIISRDTNSGAYANNVAEITQWDNLTTPLILLNAYLARSGRWVWVDSEDTGARQPYYMAKAVDPRHPVFEGVTLDDDEQVVWLDPAVAPGFSSCINTPDVGNGHIIAARPDNNYILIAEWAAGTPFYADSTQTPGDKRMLFSAGTEQTSGTNIGYGVYDLTLEGQTMFLNAVAYMIGEPDELPEVDGSLIGWWKLDETSGDIVYDSIGQNDGLTYGEPLWLPTGGEIGGALKLDGVDDYAQLPIGSVIASLTDSTFAVWVNWSGSGGNRQHIFDFGDGQAVNMFLTPSTNTGQLRFAITISGGDGEDQATASQALPSGWHHVAVTIDATTKMDLLYLDGRALAIKAAMRYTPSSLGATTQNWLGRSQNPDPYFNGSLDDLRIYNRALNPVEIAQLATP